jgi:glycosyltransferase involved in cell wall biosynthesis
MKLSILIRCRNEAKSLEVVFQALRLQVCNFDWEIVVVDNESSDNTRELCQKMGARVFEIKQADFSYGRALNLGISEAKGELILLLSAHSLPIGKSFLATAIAPFDDPNMAAVRCLMVGNDDQIKNWYRPLDIRFSSPEEQKIAESKPHWVGDYPTAGCCVIRKAVWERVRFREELEANEEKVWASEVLSLGYTIRSCCDAVWYYLRKRTKAEERHRLMFQHLSLYRIYGQTPMSMMTFFKNCLRIVLASPWVAIRHIYENVLTNFAVASVPWRAKLSPRTGSVKEFDKKK